MTFTWLNTPAAPINQDVLHAARARQDTLTKPPGALGRLEDLAVRLAAMQGNERPRVDNIRIVVFAGDHGVAAEGVSAFPQEVTAAMVRNFAHGGAAISVMARHLDASLEVINLGTVVDLEPLDGVIDKRLGAGTANFTRGPAMTEEQFWDALHTGRQAAERARLAGADLFIGGEMGIGNTTSAAALACALLPAPARLLAGPGTGLDGVGIDHKATVIERALVLHGEALRDPVEALRRLGGFEIVALTGAYISCAHMGLPVLVDGFIASAAALAAARLCENAPQWLLFSHASAEPGHAYLLEALQAKPLLDLGMRLGEGSGAAVAMPLLRLACALHNDMATFAEAGIAGA